ncbi:hypothetical protein glysoja_042334 [Glycine soja]|uniref:Uncharacterized protein n=1 Tax=Glycine soja TaxID=3848 RepID=A0A0B2Q068_GLYSO|nr:hypothetical protein glysoja_042334 [Glycine soja]
MIGRANTEGSKSNVTMNTWMPQAIYPCEVPPQLNSLHDNVFRPDQSSEEDPGSKKRGSASLPIHGIIELESSSTGSSFPTDSAKPVPLAMIGVSGRKARYLHDLPRKCQNKILFDSTILNMDGKLLFIMLTIVNGIGSCFVHMFMIFSLHRPNVLPITLGSGRGFSFSTTSRTCHVPRRWTSYGTSVGLMSLLLHGICGD